MGRIHVAHDRYGGAVVGVIHEDHYQGDNKDLHDAWLHDLHRQGRDIVVTALDEDDVPSTPRHGFSDTKKDEDGNPVLVQLSENAWGHHHVVKVPYHERYGHPLYDLATVEEIHTRVGGPAGASVTEIQILKKMIQKQQEIFDARIAELKALLTRRQGGAS